MSSLYRWCLQRARKNISSTHSVEFVFPVSRLEDIMAGVFVRGTGVSEEVLKRGAWLVQSVLMLKKELQVLMESLGEVTHVTVDNVTCTISCRMVVVVAKLEDAVTDFNEYKIANPAVTFEVGNIDTT